jgi:hypothetical protein
MSRVLNQILVKLYFGQDGGVPIREHLTIPQRGVRSGFLTAIDDEAVLDPDCVRLASHIPYPLSQEGLRVMFYHSTSALQALLREKVEHTGTGPPYPPY